MCVYYKLPLAARASELCTVGSPHCSYGVCNWWSCLYHTINNIHEVTNHQFGLARLPPHFLGKGSAMTTHCIGLKLNKYIISPGRENRLNQQTTERYHMHTCMIYRYNISEKTGLHLEVHKPLGSTQVK